MSDIGLVSIGDLTVRPLRAEDAPAVYELTQASETHDVGRSLIELEEIRADWARPSYDLTEQSRGYFDSDQLVAYGEVHKGRLEAYVHPGHHGRGIGTALFGWAVERARELGYERVGQTVPITNTAAIALLIRHGCQLLYSSWILELPAGASIADVELPPGHRLRRFDPDRDAFDVYRTFEDAFNEWPNRLPSTIDDWQAVTWGRPDFEPWQILTVTEGNARGEQVVGACRVSVHEDEAWVDQIAVCREARGRGIGRALLVAAFARACQHGATTLRLNTDSRTGALGLYQHVGMTVVETYQHYARNLTREVARSRG
jgi:mycothiol synthase